jgi:hypothetical protein
MSVIIELAGRQALVVWDALPKARKADSVSRVVAVSSDWADPGESRDRNKEHGKGTTRR